MSDTTEMEKLRILTMWECGKSTSEIAKSINKSARTVQRWLSHQKREGNMNKRPRGLRPRKTTPEEDERIIQLVQENPELTLKEIMTICNLNIYKGTLRRRIQEGFGICKIDLFGLNKKGLEVHKKKRKHTNDTNKKVTDNTTNIQSEVILSSASTKTLSEMLTTSHSNITSNTDADIKCLQYEEQEHFNHSQFENTYDTINIVNDNSNLFSIADSVRETYEHIEPESNYSEFTTSHCNVKVEVVENCSRTIERKEEEVGLTPEILKLTESQIALPEKNNFKVISDQVKKSARKQSWKLKAETNQGCSDSVDNIDKPQESDNDTRLSGFVNKDILKCKKRRVKTEVSYIEELHDGEDVPKKKLKKRERRTNTFGTEAKVNINRERIKRPPKGEKEKINWVKDKKDTTDIEKKKILIMAECGMTTEDIARSLKKSRRTVQRWLSKHNKGLDMEKKERGRRPRKTTPEEDARIIQLVKENPHMSRNEILTKANINLHKVTLKNRLNEAGMFFNSQGVKILDFTESAPKRKKKCSLFANKIQQSIHDQFELKLEHHNDNDEEDATTIITCSSLAPTPTITNAILSCPTLSTTLIITNPNDPENYDQTVDMHSAIDEQTGSFHDFTMY